MAPENDRKIKMQQQPPASSSMKKTFDCDKCSWSFLNKEYLKMHRRIRHPKPIACPMCAKLFSRTGHLAAHIKSHVKEKGFQCPQCNFSSATIGALRRHDKEIHLMVKPYQCNECSKSFARKENFYSHNLRIHDVGRIHN